MRLQSCNAGCNCFSPRSAVDHAERSVRQKGSLEIGDLGKHGEWTANEFQCTHAEFKYMRLTATQTHTLTVSQKLNATGMRFPSAPPSEEASWQ